MIAPMNPPSELPGLKEHLTFLLGCLTREACKYLCRFISLKEHISYTSFGFKSLFAICGNLFIENKTAETVGLFCTYLAQFQKNEFHKYTFSNLF